MTTIYDHCPELGDNLYLSGRYDGKILVDAVPADGYTFAEVGELYDQTRHQEGFSLGDFATKMLVIREEGGATELVGRRDLIGYSNHLLKKLVTYAPEYRGTLVSARHPYIVPCLGRFEEWYGHDNEKITRGLAADLSEFESPDQVAMSEEERWTLIGGIIDNEVDLQRRNVAFGCIPTGNRDYYLSRPQLGYHSRKVELLADRYEAEGNNPASRENPLIKYLDSMLQDWKYWDQDALMVVLDDMGTKGGVFGDGMRGPRLEMKHADEELMRQALLRDPSCNPLELLDHVRASASWGWDFSGSRQFEDPFDMTTIRTKYIVPLERSALRYHSAKTIAQALQLRALVDDPKGESQAALRDMALAKHFEAEAHATLTMINSKHWDAEKGYYFDYDYRKEARTNTVSTGAFYMLLVGAANELQARGVSDMAQEELLRQGGLRVTNLRTQQQWDGIGWGGETDAAMEACQKYGLAKLGYQIADRWLQSHGQVLMATGQLAENIDVDNPLGTGSTADGMEGEYRRQSDFAFTAASIRRAFVFRRMFAMAIEEQPGRATNASYILRNI